jgi:signal transduction histidine kinase
MPLEHNLIGSSIPPREMLVHLAHELRQPLSAIESMAFYMHMTAGQRDTAIAEQAERMRQMVDSAKWMLTDILHMLQTPPMTRKELDLARLAEEVLAESWIRDGLNLACQTNLPLRPVYADAAQIQHLLRGVMHFLRRHADSPAVSIVVAPVEDRGNITISAQAPDIDLDSIFQPQATHQLFTCRVIAERHNGSFHASREAGGRLTICLELPLAAAASC